MTAQPGDGLVSQIFAQVVALAVGGLHRVDVFEEPRFLLRGLPGEEPIKIVKAVAGGPAVEGPHGGGLVRRGVVPLPEGRRLVAIMPQDLGNGGGRLGNDAGKTIEVQARSAMVPEPTRG